MPGAGDERGPDVGAEPTLIVGGRLVLEDQVLEDGALLLADGRIAYAGPKDFVPPVILLPEDKGTIPLDSCRRFDAGGAWIFPGFIDLHVHGGAGADTMDAELDSLQRIARLHASHGTTGMLATTMTESMDRVKAACHGVKEAVAASLRPDWQGAVIHGVHLEGPYINPKRAGAHAPDLMRTPDIAELGDIVSILEDAFKLITLAAELPGGSEALAYLDRAGVVVSLGHTDATFDQANALFDAGARHLTHTYNAMRSLHHREPGALGAALTRPGVLCELIADGIHVHAAAVKIMIGAKGADEVCLITDAMAACGMPEGEYTLGPKKVIVKDGSCRLEDGTLAGSVLTMDRAVGWVIEEVGVKPWEAARMAAYNPARQLGLHERKGSLQIGKDADVTVLNDRFEAIATFIEGRQLERDDPARGSA